MLDPYENRPVAFKSWDERLNEEIESISRWFKQGVDDPTWYLNTTEIEDGVKMCEKLKKYVALVNRRYNARAKGTKKVAGWQK
tara:strand:+ start:356 stop:604 length:249 start_codon:yes stop_codon:yes gene_type:complete